MNPELLPRSEADVERCARTVYVSNVCAGVSAATLRAIFEDACGEVRNIHQQFTAGRETQVTFVEFASAESAAKALALSGRAVGSGRVRVSPSKTPLKARISSRRPRKVARSVRKAVPERQKAGSAAAAPEGDAKKSAPAEEAPPAAATVFNAAARERRRRRGRGRRAAAPRVRVGAGDQAARRAGGRLGGG